jgi:hypothetical protein
MSSEMMRVYLNRSTENDRWRSYVIWATRRFSRQQIEAVLQRPQQQRSGRQAGACCHSGGSQGGAFRGLASGYHGDRP